MIKKRSLVGYLGSGIRYSKTVIICFFFEVVLATVPFGNALVFAGLINCITLGAEWDRMLFLAGIYMLLQMIMVFGRRVQSIDYMKMQQEFDLGQKKRIKETLKTIDGTAFEDDKWVTEKLNRMNRLTGSLYDEITALLRLVSTVLGVALYLVYLAGIDLGIVPWGIIAFVPSIVKSFIYSHVQLKQNRVMDQLQFKHGRIYNMFFELSFAQEVRVFHSFQYIFKKWKKALENVYAQRMKMTKTEALVDGMCLCFSMIVNTVIVYKICSVGGDAGQIAAAIPYSITVVGLVSSIDMTFKSIYYSLQELREFEEFLTDSTFQNSGNESQKEGSAIDVKHLKFAYPNGNPVLNDVSFRLKEGETVALIGKNGSGKSTLLKILAGIYNHYEGEINIFGRRPSQISKNEIGMIFQFPVQYPFNVEKNIMLQKDESFQSEFDFHVNTDRKDGVLIQGFTNSINLSGGEWQKIALARLFVHRRKANLYLFDEPTAALDARSEVEVFHFFRKQTKGKTCIYATHRLGIAKNADRILVVDGGRIVESGTHKELLKSNGLYAELYQIQSGWYVDGVAHESIL